MQELIGKKVTIHSQIIGGMEKQDVGVLESFDGLVLRLRKDNEVLYFVIHAVRMIKPF
jgi:hypothetical protein